MAETEIPIDDEDDLCKELERLRSGAGRSSTTKVKSKSKKIEVGRENGLKMKICADEHPSRGSEEA